MNIKMIGAAVLAGAMVVGCAKNDETKAEANPAEKAASANPNEVVLKVNGKELKRGQIDADVAAMLKAQGDKVPAEQRDYFKQMVQNQVAQSFIVENVLVGKAKAEGYTITDADRKAREAEFLKAVAKMPDAPKSIDVYFKKFPLGADRAKAEFENGILIDKMIKAEQAKAPKKDYKAEAQKQVDKIAAENKKNANAEADAKKKIADLKAQLDKVAAKDLPAKFAELAKANSACPSSAKGGDLGEFTHGQMVKEFDEVAFKLPVNKVSDPVKTQFGYHLVMTTKKTPAVEAKGEKPAQPEKVQASHILIKVPEVRKVPALDDVVKMMQKQDERKFVSEYVMGLVKKAKVEAFADEFKQFVPPADKPAAAAPAKKVESKPVAAPKPAKAPAKAPVEKPAQK